MCEKQNRIEKIDTKIYFFRVKLEGFFFQKDYIRKRIEKYEVKNVWIQKLKKFLGKEDTEFDFLKNMILLILEKYEKYIKKITKLNIIINKNVISQFEKNNNDAKELKKKVEIVKSDKNLLRKIIRELEGKKKRIIQTIFEKINNNFNDMSTMLLPGTNAKLIPGEKNNIDEGLKIHVAIGGEWRENLNELSGGQKTLLALSLILSLLRCKPAPVYILDEIDSALDLSQTQNIGIMLKRHFKESQFIIVSLKQGLFSNANVIFRTYLKCGMSQVTRSVGSVRNCSRL